MQKHYGVDVAAKRADDLDKKILTHITEAESLQVLELGSGSGAQALRMQQAGAAVTTIDLAPTPHDGVRTIVADLRDLPQVLGGEVFDVCLFQRTLHYLRYEEAQALLIYLRQTVTDRLYVSVTGLESDIGRAYPDVHLPVTERFAALPEADQETFSLTESVCLYTPEEFIFLLQESGWEVEECWVSAFGNVKAVCSSKSFDEFDTLE